MKKLILVAGFLFVIFGLFWWFWATTPLCQNNCSSKDFIVDRGESIGGIAQHLENEKLIRSSVAFQLLVVQKGLTKRIQAGVFRLNGAMNPGQIAQKLTHGTDDRRVTILEGWRREEIAQQLSEKLSGEQAKFNKAEFLILTKDLEGQLFPDTYFFSKDVDTSKVIGVLNSNFQNKVGVLKSSNQTLILASIIEREAKHENDRPIVAGILLRRLSSGWPLQVDATIQYAVANSRCASQRKECDWWPSLLSAKDLEIKSPYNTYLYRGLPPKPISNPGLQTIKATLSPKETEYWYYLSDREGKIYYAKTIEEHNRNVMKYLR